MAIQQELYWLWQTFAGLSNLSNQILKVSHFSLYPVHQVSQGYLPRGQVEEGGVGLGGDGEDLHWLCQAAQMHQICENCLPKVYQLKICYSCWTNKMLHKLWTKFSSLKRQFMALKCVSQVLSALEDSMWGWSILVVLLWYPCILICQALLLKMRWKLEVLLWYKDITV